MTGLTIDNPVTFAEAIQSQRVVPGDVLKLLPGTYTATRRGLFSGSDNAGKGVFQINLHGTQAAPVVIEPYTKGTVRINGGLELVNASHVIVRDLEIAPTPTTREIPRALLDFPSCVYCASPGCSFVGNYLHDGSEGFSIFATGGCTVQNNLVLNIGWTESDGGHGTGIYTHNHPGGLFTIQNNIFHAYGDHAVNMWSKSVNAVQDYQCLANVVLYGRLFCGCESGVCANNTINDNHVWRAGIRLGRPSPLNGVIMLSNNRAYAISSAFVMLWQRQAEVLANKFISDAGACINYWAATENEANTLNNNQYFGPGANIGARDDEHDVNISWQDWRAKGYDLNSTVTETLPRTNEIFIYDKLLVVWNWEGLDSVTVDLPIGTVLTNAQDPADVTVFSGSVDMRAASHTVAAPVGTGLATPATTFPTFGAWRIE